MNQLALLTIIEYRKQSLQVCKKLVNQGRTIEADAILTELEKNINQALEDCKN